MSVYTGMVARRVAFQPYAIDGNVMYEIVCKKHEWHKKHENSHYWASTLGKNKVLKAQGNVQNSSGHSNAKIKDASCTTDMVCQIQRA